MMLWNRWKDRTNPLILHPGIFIGGFLLVGFLFAIQQWVGLRMWYRNTPITVFHVVAAWELQYLVWGGLCWLLWFWFGKRLQKADWKYLISRILPLSILLSVGVEMILVITFPPMSKKPLSFWQKLDYDLTDEFLGNTAIFWSAFVVFRAFGYYKELREEKLALSELKVELTQAQMQALRMQINPHFLFNTMNNISSLMQTDVHGADIMLEQLSSMLRISLDRGSQPMIPLSDELEFIEMYVALQDRRYAGRVRRQISIEPELYDALIPSMLLQPLVENAYVHGLSRIATNGILELQVRREQDRLAIMVRNSGVGWNAPGKSTPKRNGIGLSNIRSRLQLHFHEEQTVTIREIPPNLVQIDLSMPLIFSHAPEKKVVAYGAS